jgi:cardiolipin synthase (CMP-forming)
VSKYFDASFPSVEVSPPFISKLNTFLQLGLMAVTLAGSALAFNDHFLMESFRYTHTLSNYRYIVAITTIWSGLYYVFVPSAFKFLHKVK